MGKITIQIKKSKPVAASYLNGYTFLPTKLSNIRLPSLFLNPRSAHFLISYVSDLVVLKI